VFVGLYYGRSVVSIPSPIPLLEFPDATQSLGTTLQRDPCAHYPDPGAAADWLSKAFGFTIRLRIANHRIQMKAGDGCLTVAEGTVAPNNSHIVQVRIEDAESHCKRARQNGAIILSEPKDQPYGERQYNAQDFCGHRWDFTQTIADIAPEEWSGGAFHLE